MIALGNTAKGKDFGHFLPNYLSLNWSLFFNLYSILILLNCYYFLLCSFPFSPASTPHSPGSLWVSTEEVGFFYVYQILDNMHFLVFQQLLKGNESSDSPLLSRPSVGADKWDPILQKAPEIMVKSIGSRARSPERKPRSTHLFPWYP